MDNEMVEEIRNLPTKKKLGPNCFIDEFYQNFKGEIMSVLLKLFHKIKRGRTLPNSL
jgi:hypothetical protein